MDAIYFDEANGVLGKDQPEYRELPVHIDQSGEGCPVTFCLQVSIDEMAQIADTGHIWITVMTFGQGFPPILVQTEKPKM
jgi:hypothetical protein